MLFYTMVPITSASSFLDRECITNVFCIVLYCIDLTGQSWVIWSV